MKRIFSGTKYFQCQLIFKTGGSEHFFWWVMTPICHESLRAMGLNGFPFPGTPSREHPTSARGCGSL